MSRPVITLTTDFGLADAYVGTLKGIILSICPAAALVDISHEVRPYAVRQAAYLLQAAMPYFPPGTVHLVVVDPGVGSQRRPIAVQTEQATYVAPDNGVLSQAFTGDPTSLAVHLTRPEYRLPCAGATFHGRDIFAPAAAHLACGVDPRTMGEPLPITDLVALPAQNPIPQGANSWLAQVIHVDRFGNLVTNYQGPVSTTQYLISVGERQIVGLHQTYSSVGCGELVAYLGSSGYLEIAMREGNAAAALGIDVGAPVQVRGGS